MSIIPSKRDTIEHASAKTARVGTISMRPADFGCLTFTGDVMLKRLPAEVFEKLQKTMRKGTALDPAIANTVAGAMKDWAFENGCTH